MLPVLDARRDGGRSTPPRAEPVEVLIERAGGGRRPGGASHARRRLRAAGRGAGRQGQQRRRRPGRRAAPAPRGASASRCSTPHAAPAALPPRRPGDRRRLRHRVPRRVRRRPTPATRRCWRSTSPRGRRAAPARRAGGSLAADAHGHLRRPQAGPPARAGAVGCAGEVEVADIGLDVTGARAGLVEAATWPAGCHAGRRTATSGTRPCGSWPARPGMTGAAHLAAAAAQRAGAGYVRLSTPGRRRRPGRADRGRRAWPCPAAGLGGRGAGRARPLRCRGGRAGARAARPATPRCGAWRRSRPSRSSSTATA